MSGEPDAHRIRAEHAALFESRLIGVARIRDGRIVRVNHEFSRITGHPEAHLEGAPAEPFLPDDGSRGATGEYQRAYVRPDGARRTLSIAAAHIPADEGHADVLVSVADITEQQDRTAALERARALLMQAVDSMSDGFVLFGPDDRVVLCNHVYTAMLDGFGSARSMTGMHVEEIIRRQVERGQPIPEAFAGDIDRWVAERLAQHRRADGQPHVQQLSDGRWVQSIRHRTPDGGIVVLRSDITALKASEHAARVLAQHDALTGLPNRRLLTDRLAQALARAARAKDDVAVLLIDLDGFKPVNDTFGHETGDEVLRVIAGRLTACLRSTDTVARFGGDEFVAVIDGLAQPGAVDAIAAKIVEAVSRPLPPITTARQRTPELRVGCSIGISRYPADGGDPDALIRLADAAMYEAKQARRAR